MFGRRIVSQPQSQTIKNAIRLATARPPGTLFKKSFEKITKDKAVAVLPTPDGVWHRDSHYWILEEIYRGGAQHTDFNKGFTMLFVCEDLRRIFRGDQGHCDPLIAKVQKCNNTSQNIIQQKNIQTQKTIQKHYKNYNQQLQRPPTTTTKTKTSYKQLQNMPRTTKQQKKKLHTTRKNTETYKTYTNCKILKSNRKPAQTTKTLNTNKF